MRSKAFTLIELLIVIAIVALLAGALVPMLRTSRYEAQLAKVLMDLEAIKTASHALHLDTGYWPPADNYDGTSLLTNDDGSGDADPTIPGWNGPYLDRWINDPWGNPYATCRYTDANGLRYCQTASRGKDGEWHLPDPNPDDIELLITPDVSK